MADSIKDAVRIYKIVHNLIHFESSAPQGGEVDEGTVLLCQRLRPAPRLPHISDKDRLQHFYYGGIYEMHAIGDDAIAAMEMWLRDTLRGSVALAAEVSTRINPGPLDAGTVLPAVSFAQISVGDVPGAGGVIFDTWAHYRVCVVT